MIVIVLGMHRSGTSAVAGMLHKNGVVMGREKDFYPPPIKENPKGFYENVRFRRLNDLLLKKHHYRVKSFSTDLPEIDVQHGEMAKRMGDLVCEYNNEFSIWGWKDPRTLLTIPAWLGVLKDLDLLEEVRVVLMKRHLKRIAYSMRRRGNKERYAQQFETLAARYYNRIYFYFDVTSRILSLDFDYEILKNIDNTCSLLSTFLEHPIIDCSHIEPSISKSGKEIN